MAAPEQNRCAAIIAWVCKSRLDPAYGLARDGFVAALLAGDPAVAVGVVDADGIALNPQTVEPGEEELVLVALRCVLAGGRFEAGRIS
jgi:hypothetical protein